MLALVGLDVPNYKMRDILTDLKKNNRTDGEMLSKDEFEKVILSIHFNHVLHSVKLALSIPFLDLHIISIQMDDWDSKSLLKTFRYLHLLSVVDTEIKT